MIPTAHGYIDEEGEGGAKVRKYFVGEEGANGWRSGMEVGTMMSDGIGEHSVPSSCDCWHGWMGGSETGRWKEGVELASLGCEL